MTNVIISLCIILIQVSGAVLFKVDMVCEEVAEKGKHFLTKSPNMVSICCIVETIAVNDVENYRDCLDR